MPLRSSDEAWKTDLRQLGFAPGLPDPADATPPDAALAPPRAHLRYLDGLRGVAILMVLMVHTGQLVAGLPTWLRDLTFYGVRGVQLFFVVSGLTLMLNYAGRPFHPANFAARRFFRIAPMFYLGAVLYLVLSRTTTMPLSTDAARPIDVVATFLFLHGWLPGAINTVVPGGWSIAAEAMFYVVFPFLLALSRRRRAMTVALIASYALAVAANVVLKRTMGASVEGAGFALSFWLVHLPAFASGCWLAVIAAPCAPGRRLALALLAASIVGFVVDSQLRGRSNLLVAIVLLTLFVWSCGAARPRLLEGRLLPLIGQVSFSLYILQFAVLGLLHPFAPAMEVALGPVAAFVALYAVALTVTGALSYCTYRWIELPAIDATRRVGLKR